MSRGRGPIYLFMGLVSPPRPQLSQFFAIRGIFFFLKLESGDVTIVKKRLVVASFLQLIIIPPHASHTPTLHANCSAAITHVAIKNLKYG